MKAIQYRSYGDHSENRLVDLPQPALRDGEVLVAMRTVGINPLDNTFRSGHFYGATPENLPRIGGQPGGRRSLRSHTSAGAGAADAIGFRPHEPREYDGRIRCFAVSRNHAIDCERA